MREQNRKEKSLSEAKNDVIREPSALFVFKRPESKLSAFYYDYSFAYFIIPDLNRILLCIVFLYILFLFLQITATLK